MTPSSSAMDWFVFCSVDAFCCVCSRSTFHIRLSHCIEAKGLWKERQFQKSEITMEVGGWVQVSWNFFCKAPKSIGKETSKSNGTIESHKHILFVFTRYNRLFDFNRVHLQ